MAPLDRIDASRDGSAEQQRRTPEYETNRIRSYLSGKQMRPAEGRTRNLSLQRFYVDGRWEGSFAQIEIVEREGRWDIRQNTDGQNMLCITVSKHNGKEVPNPFENCENIVVYPETSTALLWVSENHDAKVKMEVSDIEI